MLCLSRLSATIIKIQSKINRLCSGKSRILGLCGTKGQVTPKSIVRSGPEFVREFMPVQIIWKPHKDSIKTKQAILRTRSKKLFFGTQRQVFPKWRVWSGRNSNSSQILMAVLVICEFEVDLIKSEVAILRTTFSHYKSIGNIFIAQGQ